MVRKLRLKLRRKLPLMPALLLPMPLLRRATLPPLLATQWAKLLPTQQLLLAMRLPRPAKPLLLPVKLLRKQSRLRSNC